jgi:hypothetical protein
MLKPYRAHSGDGVGRQCVAISVGAPDHLTAIRISQGADCAWRKTTQQITGHQDQTDGE